MKFKSREEYDKAKLYFTKENCPFCTCLKKNRIIFSTKYFIILENLMPYFDSNYHLLVVPKRHIEFTSELNKNEFADFVNVEKWMKEYFSDKGDYFSFIRQTKGNKSVEHLHYHYLLGCPSAKMINSKKVLEIEN